MWEIKNAYNILLDNPEGKRIRAKPRHRFYEYIYIYIYIYQNRMLGCELNSPVSTGSRGVPL